MRAVGGGWAWTGSPGALKTLLFMAGPVKHCFSWQGGGGGAASASGGGGESVGGVGGVGGGG